MDSEELRWTEPNEAPGGGTLAGGAVDAMDGETDFEPGATLGRYVVLARMGSGGMGVVYAAYDPQLDRRIALKLMHQRGDDEEQAEHASRRMLAEAKAMAQLSHPNVITVHDVGTIDGRVFIAMEFVEGVPLSQWMRQPGRDWRQLLEVFTKAGRGLEAAHAVGLVHRDFKPDNVLVGADGRVRVLDFGLARRFDGTREQGADRRDREAGTPAYMSPEQHLGKLLDHRSDQFSFCVALYEALYGELPFAAKTRFELALAVTDGRVGPAPKRAAVPNWLRWALLRGLDPEPEGRWPDMGALLGALSRDPSRRWRVLAIASAGMVLAAVGVVTGVYVFNRVTQQQAAQAEPPSCSASAEQEIARVWNDGRVSSVREVFAKVHEPWAAELGRNVEGQLSAWARGWQAMHAEACEATVQGRQSDDLLDARMLCLQRHRAEFDQLVTVMTGAEAESLMLLGQAVQELSSLRECEAERVERSARGPQRSDAEQLILDQIERDLNKARSLELTGAFGPARELAAQAVASATPLSDQRLLALGLLTQARIDIATGAVERALPLLEDAELAAERAGADRLRGDILLTIARIDCQAGDARSAKARVREARAVLDRIGAESVEYAELAGVEALAAHIAGEHEQAEQLVRAAIDSIGVPASPDERVPIELAPLQATLGEVLIARGEQAEARAALEAARTLWIDRYGEQHPAVAQVGFELADLDAREGAHERAVEGFTAARDRFEQVFGATSLDVGLASVGLGESQLALGRSDLALAEFRRAIEILRPHVDGRAAAVELARALDGEAQVLVTRGELERALELRREALSLLDDPADAQSSSEHALAAAIRVHLVADLLALERFDAAQREVVAMLEHLADGHAPELRASTRWLAARAFAQGESADPTRARELAVLARGELEALGRSTEVAEIDAWLADSN